MKGCSGGYENRCVKLAPMVLLITTLAVGCSSGSRETPPAALELPSTSLSDTKECSSVDSVKGASHVRRCTTPTGDVFLTEMRDCTIPEKFSYQATTRQLLVGLTDLTAIKQQAVELGARKVLRSLFSATLDADKVLVATFTFREGRCVTDLICWRSAPAETAFTQELERFTLVASRIADNVLGVPSHDTSN
jgi:hypothetical protein